MGKDLKGKELGKGICQRKDGLYFAGGESSTGCSAECAKFTGHIIGMKPIFRKEK